ncbi:hypothetical protein SAMN02745117_01010 [Lampropedia hyalina DSM 16112]|jgi:hypothetical protein|uniref:Uncharacterized protein n=1 Tax=Lampropedia hyalina DSM 16112 TaxID=1122156 RepID=A0A1M4XAZ8_9BURK|nr:hypothetical protein [Lampropedia hyalina]SHE90580.1 hypothetical protein SAMN02745117_01010 [Lampropedia hyalina DSM 16112]
MTLKSNIDTWTGLYNNTGINAGGGNPAYIGSVIDVNGNPHVGPAIYTGVGNAIWEFNWYAGQGLPSGGTSGGKFLVESTGGFSWDTVPATGSLLSMETEGSLNTLYLGTNALGDTGASPGQYTVTTFNPLQPLLVVDGFNYVVDYAATLFGASDGNDTILLTDTTAGGLAFEDLMSKPGYYGSATMNAAVLYNLAFEENVEGVSIFEWALDQYLKHEGAANGIADTWTNIDNALSDTNVSIDYYAQASTYASGGVITSAAAEVESDLLLAA